MVEKKKKAYRFGLFPFFSLGSICACYTRRRYGFHPGINIHPLSLCDVFLSIYLVVVAWWRYWLPIYHDVRWQRRRPDVGMKMRSHFSLFSFFVSLRYKKKNSWYIIAIILFFRNMQFDSFMEGDVVPIRFAIHQDRRREHPDERQMHRQWRRLLPLWRSVSFFFLI